MKTKCLLFFMVTLIGLSNLCAQPYFTNPVLRGCCPEVKQRLDSIINNAPFIIEGKMIESDYRNYKAEDGTIFKSFLFEIEKVYRGGDRIKEGTIELITQLKPYRGISCFAKEHWYLIVCDESNIGNIYKTDNDIKLKLYYDIPNDYSSYISEYHRVKADGEFTSINPYYSGLSLEYETQKEVRKFLKGYGLTPENPQPSPKLKSSETNQLPIEKSPYYKTKQEKKEWFEQLKKQKHILDSISDRNLKKMKQTGFD